VVKKIRKTFPPQRLETEMTRDKTDTFPAAQLVDPFSF
jgi:hypothetical protein